ncbi:helix-turn-helix domain-containing protein [Ornithinibacillus halophilus]|uniref:Uncharacterized protein YpbB n=1 Tax=Ornithinibacillus halophilus TaxID=930117 RepID=A0A1M5CSF2_9BACI|nr:helix-turn-helix domain-containing protein [Ornithinibacillus halophilus]SHF57630.1 Uncharacterized protein YpbB [Ornithinibacillus halophilus]
MLFEALIIKCIQQIKLERTVYATYHLLKGKKSIQTLHDAKLYGLERYYGVYPSLDKRLFDSKISLLLKCEYIVRNSKEESFITITTEGIDWFNQTKKQVPIHYFYGHHNTDAFFFERLLLVIQTYTNIKMNNFSFIPITEKPEITNWVRQLYRNVGKNPEEILSTLYDELHELLITFTDLEASLLVDRFTGYKYYGMSVDQLSEKYELPIEDVPLLFMGMSQKMQQLIKQNQSAYPLLSLFIVNKQSTALITKTAQQTYHFLKQGYNIGDIARIRKLKENTIQDHLVEIALHEPEFPLSDYVTVQQQDMILHAIKEVGTYKLKVIMEAIDDTTINYFQIRLVLARMERGEEYATN